MADKIITIREPRENNIIKLTVNYSAGIPQSVETHTLIPPTELTPGHARKTVTPWEELEESLQLQLAAVKSDALERVKEDLGFKEKRPPRVPPEEPKEGDPEQAGEIRERSMPIDAPAAR